MQTSVLRDYSVIILVRRRGVPGVGAEILEPFCCVLGVTGRKRDGPKRVLRRKVAEEYKLVVLVSVRDLLLVEVFHEPCKYHRAHCRIVETEATWKPCSPRFKNWLLSHSRFC